MPMEVIGYARVSTREQNLDLQMDALRDLKCSRIFFEKTSGVKGRPELGKVLEYVRKGDTLVIWKLDRLGRSLLDLVTIINKLSEKGVNFVSIKDNIDTNTITGRFLFGLFATLAQFEREIIIQRTHAGLQAARERGRIGGRKKGLSKEAKAKAKIAKQLYESGDMKVNAICKTLNIGSKATLYRYLRYTKTSLDKRT